MTSSLRRDLNLGTTWSLPEWSTGPRGDEQAVLEAARDAGYQGVQGADPRRCDELGLVPTAFDFHAAPGGLVERARVWADLGFACCTLFVGNGLESDDDAARLVEEVLVASTTTGIPLYVETHRATVTQDIWRTVQLVRRFPELRFNGDFSHWYTGHEMAAGDFDAKLEFLTPVLERVRYLHGRISTAGCIQVDVGDGRPDDAPPVAHFRAFWTRAFAGFLAMSAEDPVAVARGEIGFAPELLPPELGYARLVPGDEGQPREEGDRWTQALVLTRIATGCFAAASAIV
jgi:sugar phosphate isomerase/epimerase